MRGPGGLVAHGRDDSDPTGTLIISKGGLNITSSIDKVVQPLTRLRKIKAENGIARAEVQSTEGKARQAEDKVALTVHQLYYKILIAEAQRSAARQRFWLLKTCRANGSNKHSLAARLTWSSLRAGQSRFKRSTTGCSVHAIQTMSSDCL
jgi:hypothetical protein